MVHDQAMATEPDSLDNNHVALSGVFAGEAVLRTLPSGDELVSFRVTVARPPGDRVRVDSIDCASTRPLVRRGAIRCQPGDLVTLSGRLRRRFWRSPAGTPASRYEVEVTSLRRDRSKAP
jgi:single-strand DNA-binding protein